MLVSMQYSNLWHEEEGVCIISNHYKCAGSSTSSTQTGLRYQIIHRACIRPVHNRLSFICQFLRLGKADVLSYPLPLPWIPNDHVFQGGGDDQGRSGPLAPRLQQNNIRLSTVDYTEGRQANVAKVLLLGQRHRSTWVIVNGRRVP